MNPRFWLVCYDISNDTARRHLAEHLLDDGGARVQKSVFELGWSRSGVETAQYQHLRLLSTGDKLMYAPLCATCRARVKWHGKGLEAAAQPFWVI
jgi:CRISPR-associated endonuclease Cas2